MRVCARRVTFPFRATVEALRSWGVRRMKWRLERDKQSPRGFLSLIERVAWRLLFGPADLIRLSR